jgi:ATP-dependent helicase/nuclease subunit B
MMSQHARVGAFYIKGLEIAFGSDGELPALRLPLEEGLEMEIIGRIDRVDVAENEQGLYVRIIDYKSSRTELDLSKVYHGLSLQMLTYLDVLMTHAKSWLGQKATPAGLLYFHVHLPLIQVRQPMEDSKLDKEKLKAYKMKGLVLADKEVVQLMDTSLNSSHSEVIPVALTKDGGFYASSSVAQPEQFDQLRQYVRQKIRDIGMKIMSGETMIQPVRLKQELACTHCSYRAVCHFDPELEENRYNDLIHLPKQTALAYMNQEDV